MFGRKNENGDEENQKKLENTSRWEDIKVIIAVIILMLIAVVVVLINYFVTFREVRRIGSMENMRDMVISFYIDSLILV